MGEDVSNLTLVQTFPERDSQLLVGLDSAFTAVSYTHLRAHETVLDLVCRLLLEKKKKETSHHHPVKHVK